MVALLAFAGLAEAVGVVTLIPLLELAESGGQASSRIGEWAVATLDAVALRPTVATLLAVIVGAIVVKAGLLWMAMRQVGFTVAHVTRDLRLHLIQALLRARWSYFSDQPSGRFANTISSEAIRSASAYREACQVLAGLFIIAAYLTVSALISWQITLFALVSGLGLVALLRGFVRMSRAAGLDQTTLTRSLAGRLVDAIQGIKPIKAMAKEELVWPLLEEETEGLNQAHRRQVVASEGLKFFQEPALTVLLAISLYILLEISNEPLSTVLVLAFVFYRLMRALNTVQMRYQVMTVGESAFWSLKAQIDEAERQREVVGRGLPGRPLRQELRIENVTFAYDERPVLRGVDLVLPAGTFLSILGESGSGKTTLADLVVGLHRPLEGKILIDGTPLEDIDRISWRKEIGYVPQEMLLFNDSIFRNITLGEEALSAEDVERALRLAGALGFVQDHPDGLDAMVGEKGSMLSGGQRQRIAIARALVTRPSLLILDEVTTALDPATERAICDTLRGLEGKVTILSISHQPAMREAADIAYVLRDGRLEPTDAAVRAAP